MFFSGISHAILICTYDLNDMYGYDYMVLQISENDKLEEEETEPRRKKHTIEAINAMRTPRTEWKSKHTNSNKLPVHANGLHTVASCNVLVFVAVCLFFCLFFLCRIALCHIAHIIVTGNVYIKLFLLQQIFV